MSFVFISYSTKNKAYADTLAEQLQYEGFDVWIDARINSGDDWWHSIMEALRGCSAIIVIMSSDSENSNWVQREITIADQLQKVAFPMLLEGDSNLVNSNQWSIYIRTQYEDVRSGKLPTSRFYNRLEQAVPRRDKGRQLAPSYEPENTLSKQELIKATPLNQRLDGFRIIVRRGPQQDQAYELKKEIVSLGRDATNDIAINDHAISRHHLRFSYQENGFLIEDLGSINGTFLNGERLTQKTMLKDGDMIEIGRTVALVFVIVRTLTTLL